MIRGKENLDIKYWSRNIPSNLEITSWERKQIREYFIEELGMTDDLELDFQSTQLKLVVDVYRRISYNLSE